MNEFKRLVFSLKNSLNRLSNNTEDLSLLREIQFKIITSIIRRERCVKLFKRKAAEVKSTIRSGKKTRAESKSIKEGLKILKSEIEGVQFEIYILRMFGDGLAFLYIDRFTIKQLHYNTEDYNVKEHAGNIGGKEGLKEEWNCVKSSMEMGIPALLHDITMSIRHADISLLGQNEPFLIEVKSSLNVNKRVERQKLNLEKISNFLSNDVAEGFRGHHEIKRVAYSFEDNNNIKSFNECLNECFEKGSVFRKVERGMYVYCSRKSDDLENVMEFKVFEGRQILPVYLNQLKNSLGWAPLTPFTLLFDESRDLYDFIVGDLYVICFMDCNEVQSICLERGVEVVFHDDPEYSLLFKKQGDEMIWGVSKQMLLRVFVEMSSIEWLVTESIRLFDESHFPTDDGSEKYQKSLTTNSPKLQAQLDSFSAAFKK